MVGSQQEKTKWDYIIGVLKVILCVFVAWGLKDSPSGIPVVIVCCAIVGVIVTRSIYEKG